MKIRQYVQFEKKRGTRVPLFLNQCVACQESSTANLCVEDITDKNGRILRHVGTDLSLLFHEKKFQKLNTFTLDKLVSNLKRDIPSMNDYDDKDIMETVKSRYIQSSADVRSYERELKRKMDSIVKDVEFNSKIRKLKEKYSQSKEE